MVASRFFALLLAPVLFILCGCDDRNKICPDPFPAPVLTSNSPIQAGETLQLYADDYGYYSVVWSGPNDFHSTTQNPVISPATEANGDEYTCFIVLHGCTSEVASINVVVNPAIAPCTIPDNYTNYPSGIPDVTYYSVTAGLDPIDELYQISANGNNGDLDIYFSTPDAPAPGVYNIVSYATSTSDLEPGDVRVTCIAGGTFSCFYYATYGDLYVTLEDGKLTATFCNVAFGTAQSCPYISSTSTRVVVD